LCIKKALTQRIEQLWWNHKIPPFPLRLCSYVYQQISNKHLQARAKRQQTIRIPLISIGNITVGGSGKTPFTAWLASMLRQYGMSPIILCRGDGGQSKEAVWIDQESAASMVGDEAVLLHRLTRCPVMAAQDRLAACDQIEAENVGDVILLDDGFQYRHLARNCDIVLIPAEGVGNGWMIPAGPLREPLAMLERADIIVRSSHHQQQKNATNISGQQEWQWSATAGSLFDWMQCSTKPPSTNAAVQAITGIARPHRFFDNLKEIGLTIDAYHVFSDHYDYSEAEVRVFSDCTYPITTGKDAVKLMPYWPPKKPLWVLEQKITVDDCLIEKIISAI